MRQRDKETERQRDRETGIQREKQRDRKKSKFDVHRKVLHIVLKKFNVRFCTAQRVINPRHRERQRDRKKKK